MIWPFAIFWPFLNVEDNSIFLRACFGEIGTKLAIFYEIFTSESCYFNNFFEENLAFIWPFFIFDELAFLKLPMDKFGLFNFLDLATLLLHTHTFQLHYCYGKSPLF